MKYLKQIVSIGLSFAICVLITVPTMGQSVTSIRHNIDDAKNQVEQLFETVNIQDWDTFSNLMFDEEKSYFEYYFSNDELTDGIKQVQSADIVNLYEVDNAQVKDEWLTDEYSILETSGEVFSLVAEVNCAVSKENQYFYNGINYFLIVLANEDGKLKVVQINRPSVDLIKEVVEPSLDEDAEMYQDELDGINVLDSAEKGLVVNAENEILTDGFTTVTENIDANVSILSADPPVINHYSSYSYPTSIKVKLNKTGNNQIVSVSFTNYLKNVLPNEWIPSWDSEALKAGAYCVKMVGIYRAVNPMSSAGGYNLTQSTQMYKPGSTLYTSTSNAIDSIKNQGMADTAGRLFFPHYVAGTSGNRGSKGSGELQQYGSQKLASSDGYTYKQILNYYSGTDYSSGDVNFFSYNFGF